MIGKLRGKVDSVEEDHLILDVGGVGYLVFCHARLLAALSPNSTAELLIETHVREDHFHLYGFSSRYEREWFRLLTTVQGVGVKLGLAILSTFSPEEILTIIAAQDKKAIGRVSGVGPKLAERIVLELKSKAVKASATQEFAPVKSGSTAANGGTVAEDAVSALSHLGYGRSEAFVAVQRAIGGNAAAKLDDIIRTALKELAA